MGNGGGGLNNYENYFWGGSLLYLVIFSYTPQNPILIIKAPIFEVWIGSLFWVGEFRRRVSLTGL